MLIICNGAFKSGSTWLMNVTRGFGRTEPISGRWQNSSVDPDKMINLISVEGLQNTTYLGKNYHSEASFVESLMRKVSTLIG